MAKTVKAATGMTRARPDGRAQMLIYMKPAITMNLKRAALDEGRPAYEIVEELVESWLKTRKKK